jgi:hypothetical protein
MSEMKFTASKMMNKIHRNINAETMMTPILKITILAELTAGIMELRTPQTEKSNHIIPFEAIENNR